MAKRQLRITFATDFHGSEVCFRKLFNLARHAKTDAIVLGGDLCGKALVPLVSHQGEIRGEFMGESFVATTGDEVAEVEKRIRFHGFYAYRCGPDELAEINASQAKRDEAFRREMLRTVERWVGIAEEKLAGSDIPCVWLPGNDDDLVIDQALNASERVRNCDERLLEYEQFAVLGFGASNETPWHSPREFAESEITHRLQAVLDGANGSRPLIANIHVPPYRSTLDDAPLVDETLRPVRRAGQPVVGPVGSHAVRAFLEEVQPCLSLHGHVHEVRRATNIGKTRAINPGSDYASGTLQAVMATIDLAKGRVKGHQFISG
jgi:Icc-related predicted phosphoesterase